MMDDAENEKYQVIIINQLVKGQTTEKVINNLCELFNKDKKFIEQMLCQQNYIVQSDVNKEIANQIYNRIKKTGYDEDGYVIEEDKSKFKDNNYYAGTNYFRNNFANK